jgi:hypothetical protein
MAKKKPKKKWDEAPISIDHTARFARNSRKMVLNFRRNESKMALLKRKAP